MITSRLKSFQWIIPWFCCLASITWFSWQCHAQGGLPAPVNGIVLNLTSYNMTYNEGDTLNISATYRSTPSAHYAVWLKDGNPLFYFNISSTIVGRFVPCPPLVIRNMSCADSGQYVLFVNNSLGHHFSYPVTVYVIIPSGRPVNDIGNPYCIHAPICFPRGPTDILVREGTAANLAVNITTNPGLSFADWLYSTDVVNRSDPRYQNGNVNNPSLIIDRVQRTDVGTYALYANNSIGPLRTPNCTFSLDVGYPPECDGCNTSACHVVNETESCILPINNIDVNPELTSLQWFKGSSPIVNTTGRFLGGSIANPSLTVTNTNRNDTGNYTLTARNVYGDGRCVCCCVVQFRPTCVLLFPLSFGYNAIEGDTFRINVSLTALPVPGYVDWTLNAVPINRTGPRYTGGNTTTASLTVHQIHRRDVGIYALYANNTVGEMVDTNCRVNVTVLYRPYCILLSNFILTYKEFSTFTINVSLDSVPPAHVVQWSHNGVPVNRASGRFLNGETYQVPSLTIRNVTRRETGVYVLNATNTVGSIVDRICSVNLTIWYIPGFIDCPKNYSICEDAPVTLDCEVDSLPPINTITWRKDGVILNVSNPRYSGGNVTIPSLTINNVATGDQGVYECDVGNVVGRAVCPMILQVPSKPIVSVSRTAIALIEGQSSSLGCSVDMRINPPPVVVQWFKDGILINSSRGRYQHGNLDVPSLTITNIQREDAGVYSCGAINAIGDRQSRNIIVTVEYPPTVHVKYNNYGFPLYTNASLWCSVDANPPVPAANITWVRDGSFTLPSTFCTDVRPNVRLCNVETTDAGVYRCRAIHRLATRHSEDIQVYVRDDCLINIEEIRLSDGTPNISGRVEVRESRTWGTVCGRYWTPLATQVVCGMFGYSFGTSSMIGAGTGPIHIGHARCEEGATTLSQCGLTSISNCTHNEDIWVQCGPVPVTTVAPASTPVAGAGAGAGAADGGDGVAACVTVTNNDGYLLATIILGILLGLSLIINCGYIMMRWKKKCGCLCTLTRKKKKTQSNGKANCKDEVYNSCKDILYYIFCCIGGKSRGGKDDKHNGNNEDNFLGCFRCACCVTDTAETDTCTTSTESTDSSTPRPIVAPLSKTRKSKGGGSGQKMEINKARLDESWKTGSGQKMEINKARRDESWEKESTTVVKKMRRREKETTKDKRHTHEQILDRRKKDRENEEKRRKSKKEDILPLPDEIRSDKDTLPLLVDQVLPQTTKKIPEYKLSDGKGSHRKDNGGGGVDVDTCGSGRGGDRKEGKGDSESRDGEVIVKYSEHDVDRVVEVIRREEGGLGGAGQWSDSSQGSEPVIPPVNDIDKFINGLDAPTNNTLGGGRSGTDGALRGQISNGDGKKRKKRSRSEDNLSDTNERRSRADHKSRSKSGERKTRHVSSVSRSGSISISTDEDAKDDVHQQHIRINYRENKAQVYDNRYYRSMDHYV